MTGQIAQLNIPDDGGGNPQLIVMDWPRGKMYFLGLYAVRSYRTALVTQYPIFSSLNLATTGWALGADVDPLTGNIIAQRTVGIGLINGQPINRLDPDTFAVTGTFGVPTSFPSYPTSVWAGEGIVCVGCGTLASGGATQVGYALLKYTTFSGAVAVIRTDTMQHAGWIEDVVSGDVDNRGFIIRGASGSTKGSVFLTWSNTGADISPALPVWEIVISPGAETYNPASWPTRNPYIHQRAITPIPATSVDPSWNGIGCAAIGYDQADGNVILHVQAPSYGTGTIREYIIKIDATTGAVLWRVPTASNSLGNAALGAYNVDGNNTVGQMGVSAYRKIDAITGVADPVGAIGGLTLGSITSISNNTGELYFTRLDSYTGAVAHGLAPVDGTPNAFISSYAWIHPNDPPAAKLAMDNIVVQDARLGPSFGLVYRWRSKQFYLPAPASLGACQVSLDPSVSLVVTDVPVPPLDNADPLLYLPPGVNAMFRLYVGPDGGNLFMEKVLDQPRTIFRLPSGLKAFNWQFEIVARVPIHSVELASTMRELKQV